MNTEPVLTSRGTSYQNSQAILLLFIYVNTVTDRETQAASKMVFGKNYVLLHLRIKGKGIVNNVETDHNQ